MLQKEDQINNLYKKIANAINYSVDDVKSKSKEQILGEIKQRLINGFVTESIAMNLFDKFSKTINDYFDQIEKLK